MVSGASALFKDRSVAASRKKTVRERKREGCSEL